MWIRFLNWMCISLFLVVGSLPSILARRMKEPRWWKLGAISDLSNLMSNEILSNSLTDHFMPEAVYRLLKKKQRRILRENRGALKPLIEGTRIAYMGCQEQLKNRRYNCTSFQTRNQRNLFGNIVSIPVRETSFIYAITSAAVLHSVTRACTEGKIHSCNCDYRSMDRPDFNYKDVNHKIPVFTENHIPYDKPLSWHWGGCSENIYFGDKFTKSFMEADERGHNAKSIMNLHNSKAGRLHVSSKMLSECKCHGMSGSCGVKTCWRRMPHFKKVTKLIKDRFNRAYRVITAKEIFFRSNDRRWKRKSDRLYKLRAAYTPNDPDYKLPSKMDLIYFDRSPSFCRRNRKLGVYGTRGRECNSTSLGIDGCDIMCCGRGYRSRITDVKKRCSCTFEWCCEVKCKICHHKILRHTCK